MNAKFCWFAPTSGDYKYVSSSEPMELPSMDYIIEIAKKAEKANFDDILIPIDPRCMDPIVSAAYILENTNTINTLIAYRPGITSPQVLATMLSTLDKNKGRVRLNMVQGTSADALQQGYSTGNFEHSRARMKSFSKSFRELLYSSEMHSYKDDFITYEDATVNPKIIDLPPQMFIGGGEYAMHLAGEMYEYYMTFGDSIDQISIYVKNAKDYAMKTFNRELKVGIGINIVARETSAEAWEACQNLVSNSSEESFQEAEKYYSKYPALGGRSIEDLKKNNYIIDTNVWAGLAMVRSGPVATIYGSYQEVADKLKKYCEIGVEYFSLTGYPYIEEVENVGKVIKIFKSRELIQK